MQALLAQLLSSLLPLINKYIVSKLFAGVVKLITWVKASISLKKYKEELADKKEKLDEAGENPALTPEQKAKEIEDAAAALIDSANKRS